MITAGLDVAFTNDYTALVITEKGADSKIRLKHLATWRRFDWSTWKRDMKYKDRQFGIEMLYVDETNNRSVVAELKSIGMWVDGVTFTNATKRDMITNAVKLLNTGELVMPKIEKLQSPTQKKLVEELLLQMNEQEYKHDTANPRLTHPSGRHDDLLWALCLALYGITLDEPVIPVISGYSFSDFDKSPEERKIGSILDAISDRGVDITGVKIRRPGDTWRDL